MSEVPQSTPVSVIANVARVVSMAVDRLVGDRADYPLLVAAACVEALKRYGIESRVMYGAAAWIEVLEDSSVIWAGCWGDNVSFWVATQFGEVVDLNTSVAHRKRAHQDPSHKPLHSPPMLWASEVPAFYRYQPEGVAELELTEERDIKRYELVLAEVAEKCGPQALADDAEPEFPNEPILCPGRRLLDDSRQTFRHFDRALSVRGIPPAPF
jgi:hypothetical protein